MNLRSLFVFLLFVQQEPITGPLADKPVPAKVYVGEMTDIDAGFQLDKVDAPQLTAQKHVRASGSILTVSPPKGSEGKKYLVWVVSFEKKQTRLYELTVEGEPGPPPIPPDPPPPPPAELVVALRDAFRLDGTTAKQRDVLASVYEETAKIAEAGGLLNVGEVNRTGRKATESQFGPSVDEKGAVLPSYTLKATREVLAKWLFKLQPPDASPDVKAAAKNLRTAAAALREVTK